jgi:hypothetical protein
MKTQKSREDFWLRLGLINLVAMVFPMSCYLQADSQEDQIIAVSMLIAVGLLVLIVDMVSIVVAYSQCSCTPNRLVRRMAASGGCYADWTRKALNAALWLSRVSPERWTPKTLATADARPMTAREPLSEYSKAGSSGWPLTFRKIALAA